ncbi:hypothetical protein J1G43_12870 [Cellulomonas sp. zg-ZUI22]|uniref:hypothetical protein n=1 Tax=Cellulomonas sp. zg-ZUI22 TaxID=2816955 RepID=UPI001A948A1F|nr:hypothetical protein [Cellulomonas sp. zg-ZUI22]MBO0900856.1 hypothetical protein [Cellulomonas sp. zg-ZUI22]
MVERLGDVWASRDFPVLVEVARRLDAGASIIQPAELIASTGLDEQAVVQAARALERRRLLKVEWLMGGNFFVTDVSGAAYLMTGLHPDGDDVLSQLVSALRQAAEQQPDEDERGRLRKAADALGGVTRDVGVSVVAAVLARAAGMG